MDEARRVLDRLDRIEWLQGTGVEPSVLLGELRALLVEGEAWIAAEAEVGNRGDEALERLASALGKRSRAAENPVSGLSGKP